GERMTEPARLSQTLKSAAMALGFDLVGIAPAVTPLGFTRLQEWLQRGYAGEMSYLPRREAAYEHPRHVLDGVCSVVMVAVNYKSAEPPKGDTASTDQRPTIHDQPPFIPTRVAKYARGLSDYHDVLKDRLRKLSDVLHERVPGCRTRCVVDTAPLLERDFAQLAGLGWFGKNTLLIHKRAGSFLLLGALLTDVELEPDEPHETSHCGTCTRCLDVCPTDAFPVPYVLDARKCISYLTIELKGAIPQELRTGIGDWLFGCDLCQDVCPWNRKSPATMAADFQPRSDLTPADALDVLQLSAADFRVRFRGTPLERPGYNGLRRNAAIVLGNSGNAAVIPALIAALDDPSPIVRGAVAWALGQLGGPAARTALQDRRGIEDNRDVTEELDAALRHCSLPEAQGSHPLGNAP
ncbi:MAG TPA: tRNA epoxyqueuosine(34) reductase QueG, partial [Planctomycetaceae bacterium]|nr:tRNA epoxyqueuosine(34) reductase QueG [Planctomycetaceae bacterium]